jgi:hypothetical protein
MLWNIQLYQLWGKYHSEFWMPEPLIASFPSLKITISFCCYCFVFVPGIKPRASHMLGKSSTIELYSALASQIAGITGMQQA